MSMPTKTPLPKETWKVNSSKGKGREGRKMEMEKNEK
jgi:hypothetical protein